jgi:hypothetical protein
MGMRAWKVREGVGVERENAHRKQISFLLFQSVMFAGVEYAPLKTLKEAGYKTREDAQKAFFSRVRVSFTLHLRIKRKTLIIDF